MPVGRCVGDFALSPVSLASRDNMAARRTNRSTPHGKVGTVNTLLRFGFFFYELNYSRARC